MYFNYVRSETKLITIVITNYNTQSLLVSKHAQEDRAAGTVSWKQVARKSKRALFTANSV